MKPSPSDYPRRVSEDLHRYAQDLLAENHRLTGIAAACRTDRERLATEAEVLARENEQLRQDLEAARTRATLAIADVGALRRELAGRERAQAQADEQVRAADLESRRLAERFAALEEQNNNLANLYVASYRLHGTLERREVLAAVQEILANLVGSEETAIFERNDATCSLELAASNGIEPGPLRTVPLGRGVIGRVAQTGLPFLSEREEAAARAAGEEHLSACIPLLLDGLVVGAIAVFRLLPQKPRLGELDQEIFDLLASQAATAIYCTALHARVGAAPTRGHGE
jgi:hypothetical protein